MGSGRHAEGNKRGFTSILLVVALVAAVIGLGWVAFRPQGGASADDCNGGRPVVISVVPAMQVPLEKSVQSLKEKDKCFPAQVRVESPDAVEDSFFNGGRPDLWVADTGARVDRLALIGINTTTLTPSLATSPIGLAGSKNQTRPDTWIEALETEQVAYANPEVDGATALTLMAPTMEKSSTGTAQGRVDEAVVIAAQIFGDSSTGSTEKAKAGLEEISSNTTKLVPVSEQEFVTRGAGNKNVADLTPKSGAPALTFPLVKANGGAPDTDVVATELRKWFDSDAGRVALAEAGLRNAKGDPLSGRGFSDAKDLGEVPSEAFDQVLGKFGVLSVPSSLLAVFDVSGSMDFPAPGGGGTRMDFAAEAALQALEAFPPHTRIGVWAFSIDQGGKGVDYREMAPMRRLKDETDGMDHADYLRKSLTRMKKITDGGTGLYDTTIAAYEKALENYDKAYFNSVILMTDGANDDPGSASLKKVLQRLEEMQDPNRPIRIISIGITKDADLAALEKISRATGGKAFLAETPSDIMGVLAKAMMDR